ncbi:hypothetical protein Paride_0312 [Pseudomonas phage Paride]|nr:hypothetical protein Deiofobo_0310 [Pseudomonas phage Deifobo]WPK40542.1 hypothetical protein Paride_0312 [Pseudomonas phage Paride]
MINIPLIQYKTHTINNLFGRSFSKCIQVRDDNLILLVSFYIEGSKYRKFVYNNQCLANALKGF